MSDSRRPYPSDLSDPARPAARRIGRLSGRGRAAARERLLEPAFHRSARSIVP